MRRASRRRSAPRRLPRAGEVLGDDELTRRRRRARTGARRRRGPARSRARRSPRRERTGLRRSGTERDEPPRYRGYLACLAGDRRLRRRSPSARSSSRGADAPPELPARVRTWVRAYAARERGREARAAVSGGGVESRNACGKRAARRAVFARRCCPRSSSATEDDLHVAANSASTCRQMPHGAPGCGPGGHHDAGDGSRSPAATMAATADRSAQRVAPKVAFSTLHPA